MLCTLNDHLFLIQNETQFTLTQNIYIYIYLFFPGIDRGSCVKLIHLFERNNAVPKTIVQQM